MQRKLGPLIALLMILLGWMIVLVTTYEYFPPTMNVMSPINLVFAFITIGVIFPAVRRLWRASKAKA